jgi:hypothetical protein
VAGMTRLRQSMTHRLSAEESPKTGQRGNRWVSASLRRQLIPSRDLGLRFQFGRSDEIYSAGPSKQLSL